MLLKLEQLLVNGGTQPRAQLMFDVMDEYAEQMRSGDKFPPITVFFDGKGYWLADGFHRIGAHVRAFGEDAPIEADVLQGTQLDAQWYSFGVNKTHGLRRTNEDKGRAVRAALQHPKGAGRSDRQVAEHIGVHFDTVAKYRREMQGEGTIGKSDSRVSRDGRTINTAKIGKSAHKATGRRRRNKGIRISRNAHSLKRGHSDPCPMIPLQFSPNNPRTAAATLWQEFPRSFIEALVHELTQRLSRQGDSV